MSTDGERNADARVPEYAPEDLTPEMNLLNLAKYVRIEGARVQVTYLDALDRTEHTAEFEVVDQDEQTGGPFRFRAMDLDTLDAEEFVPHRLTLAAYAHLVKYPDEIQARSALGHVTDVTVLEGGDGT
ncbi:hypothetical protein G9C85_00260 [Halorubellus sp. JP-L1]|uniref:hypothetical protein n=1 Tax=Halorubellus sp. JP-L1 TaxID=2715753 RepID=UPI0014091FFF|nr:hypothetical protein [Halorubellus sp. JP-L1]NHN40071.1 hypothetical protein [Halorubellus sp. JP-L1]